MDFHRQMEMPMAAIRLRGLIERYKAWRNYRMWERAWKESMLRYEMPGQPNYEDHRFQFRFNAAFAPVFTVLTIGIMYSITRSWPPIEHDILWRSLSSIPCIYLGWKAIACIRSAMEARRLMKQSLIREVHDL